MLTGIEIVRFTLKIVSLKSSRNVEKRYVTKQITALVNNIYLRVTTLSLFFGSCPVVRVAGKQVHIIL